MEAAEVLVPAENPDTGAPMPLAGFVPRHSSNLQQQQLMQLLEQYWDISIQADDDIRQTPVLEHTIETQGSPVYLPYCWQNSTVAGGG